MRQAIAEAEVGDDVLGDDPTVGRLEKRVAEILGKEAAVFMPSGTMTNQAAIRLHTEPGDEIVMEANSHTYFYEAGGPAAISGVMCQLIRGQHPGQTQCELGAPDAAAKRQHLVVRRPAHRKRSSPAGRNK